MTTLQLVANRPDHNREITLRIKERLGRGDLTRTNLADMTGISRPTVSRRLSGGVWQLDELELVAQALHLNWNWLVTGEGNAENPHPGNPGGGLNAGGSNSSVPNANSGNWYISRPQLRAVA